MLTITIPAVEKWDEETQQFINTKSQTIQLEHSLVSLSKWESKWCKPFLTKEDKTIEETLDYIRCMTVNKNVDEDAYKVITSAMFSEIQKYIEAPMTATFFSDRKPGNLRGELITSEILYYDMIALNIPFECQKWHLNRLLTLIKICNIKSQPAKKMGRKEILSRNAALNAQRRAKINSKG